jgi:TonB-dependent starch-binding outer membrane protein SusC
MKKKYAHLFYSLIFLLVFSVEGFAQKQSISGKVSDENGETLIGVSVSIKGTQGGTTTDVSGNYQLSVEKTATFLVFSYVGYQSSEIAIEGRNAIDVKMLTDGKTLGEVVVVGYGTQKKTNLTGSVSTLNARDLENFPQSNLLNALQGQMAGLNITTPSAQPGNDAPEVNIRGIGTIGNTSPLVVIDGFQSNLANLANLTPNEVETITILKDAASAAIYGSRSANGVILVTTKKGEKNDKIKVNFDSYLGFQTATVLPDYVTSSQWLELDADAQNITLPTGLLDKINSGLFPDSLSNTRWNDLVFRTAPIRSHNLSVRGGTNKLTFQAALGYVNQEGIMRGTNSDRMNFRVNTRSEINKNITFGVNTWGNFRFIHEPFTAPTAIVTRIAQSSGLVPDFYSNGQPGVAYESTFNAQSMGAFRNPRLLTEIGKNDTKGNNLNIQGFGIVTLAKGLVFSSISTYSSNNNEGTTINPLYEYFDLQGRAAFVNRRAFLRESSTKNGQLQLQNYLTYTATLAKNHEISVLAGHEFIDFKSNFFRADGYDFPSNDVIVMDRALSDFSVAGNRSEWALQSFFGRANYAFKGKYLVEGNLRVDGSSRFPKNNRYAYFPSFSAGWRLSEEGFMKNIKQITNLKLRASWGILGNDNIGNYTATQTYNLENNYFLGNTLNFGAGVSNLANPLIRWETTTITDLGLDLALFKNKLNVTFDVYNRLTDDILYQLPLPPSMGFVNAPVQNIASVSNKGWDLEANYRFRVNKFNFNFGANLGSYNNKIEKLNGQEAVNGRFVIKEGYPINSYFGFVNDGLFRTQEEFNSGAKVGGAGEVVGSLRFIDQNGDGTINALDRVVLGNSIPKLTYGFSSRMSFVGFDLSLLFTGITGKQVYNYENGNRPGNLGTANYWSRWYTDRFTDINTTAPLPALKRQGSENPATSSFWMDDASYLRLKNFEFGYSVPTKLLKKIKMDRVRAYVSGQNMLTFTKITNVDPERFASDISNTSYPQAKTLSFGLNIGF